MTVLQEARQTRWCMPALVGDIWLWATKFYIFFTFMWPCLVTNFFMIRPTRCTNFANLFLAWNSTCFGQCLCPSSGAQSLYTQQWYVSYRFADSLQAGSGWIHPNPARKLSTNLYDTYHCWVYSEWAPDDGQRPCPKHVEFHSKNKFAKWVHLVGLIIN